MKFSHGASSQAKFGDKYSVGFDFGTGKFNVDVTEPPNHNFDR
jgi:hypothetical protein